MLTKVIVLKIGMRTLKTSIAVTLSISLGYALNLNSPLFAGFAAIIVMQGNLVDSYRMGKNRVLGTILGATVGLLGSLLSVGNPILIGIGTIIIIKISNKLGWSKSISIATMVFISIMMNDSDGKLHYSINRVLDTVVGIIVAFVVNFVISPPLTKDKIHNGSKSIIKEFSQALERIVINRQCIDVTSLKEIERMLEDLNNEYPILLEEQSIHLYRKDKNSIDLEHSRNLIKKLYNSMNVIVEMGEGHSINRDNAEILNNLYDDLNITGDDVNKDLDIVYNYHLRTSLDCLKELKNMFQISFNN